MTRRKAAAILAAVGVLTAGCGAGKAEDEARGGGGKSKSPLAPQKLAADTGKRYKQARIPHLPGMTCDEGDGGFRYGDGLDMGVFGDDGLKLQESDSEEKSFQASCFGAKRIVLTKGSVPATVPHLMGETKLYKRIADPKASLKKSFRYTMDLIGSYGRSMVGKPRTFTTKELVIECQKNVADNFPMTTCMWANYGALGVVDFYPPSGTHVPVAKAAERTRKFAASTLRTHEAGH
ncbi:hypothetical protein [Streptomyces sp. 891-h]|uniref:hypothetical protein n=1 Tax=Streptomyces sp. 891-h TaxID=2720714 RepID=UPI001FAB29C9|nr:hypothetical protein [Streptomyces sp. 891-h]UNZ15736.1 hypothetical protein HC362_00145 [Streptomyces sp. 891-h]